GAGPARIGLSMTAFLAPVALTSLLLGAAVDRHGSARAGRAGFALLLTGGMATALAGSMGVLLAGRALAGLGGGMVLLATLKLLAIRVPAARLGRAFGIFVAGLPVGTGLAFTALGSPESEARPPRPPRSLRADLAALRALPAVPLLTLLVVLGYTAIIAFTTWAPTRLVAYGGLAPKTAALLASLLLLIDIPFAPLWGRVSDCVGRR